MHADQIHSTKVCDFFSNESKLVAPSLPSEFLALSVCAVACLVVCSIKLPNILKFYNSFIMISHCLDFFAIDVH